MKIPFLGKKLHNHYFETDCNLYLEAEARGEEKTQFLAETPGLVSFFDSTEQGEVRGMLAIPDRKVTYAVVGDILWEISTAGAGTNRGSIDTSVGPVYLISNGLQLLVADVNKGYVLTYATMAYAEITFAGFEVNSIDYMDGYAIVVERNTQKFFISGLYDFTSWDALDFASAEGSPDYILRVFVDHREAWLFGTESTEPWYNSGAAAFTFERRSGSYMEIGIGAPDSPAKLDNSIFWLTNKRTVVRVNAYQPVIVSSRLLEYQLEHLTRIDDAKGFAIQYGGHAWYVLTFPTANVTWVYDVPMNYWFRIASYPNPLVPGRHRINAYAYFDGKHLIGDYASGKVYYWSDSTLTDDGNVIRRQWTYPAIQNENKRLVWDRFEQHMKTGVGLSTDTTDDGPLIALQISDDNGLTWGREQYRSMGKMGDYDTTVTWNRQGAHRSGVARIVITDPVEVKLCNPYLTARKAG
jgi:hypothetical protein